MRIVVQSSGEALIFRPRVFQRHKRPVGNFDATVARGRDERLAALDVLERLAERVELAGIGVQLRADARDALLGHVLLLGQHPGRVRRLLLRRRHLVVIARGFLHASSFHAKFGILNDGT
ncbi:hypothetical protein AMST5_03604 [freshwater sediment metagenome]|uniref:Uncharacterized protein n=1 Tax=freshwater sediment metagenome TaxID=556182 RepID=A0AA48M298_9ZZZZ